MEIQTSYNLKCYRLSPKTINNLEKLKLETGLSYNMLFTALHNSYMKMKETTKSGKVIWDDIKENDECPYCKIGKIILKPGKWGSFWACSNFPNCGFTQSIKK